MCPFGNAFVDVPQGDIDHDNQLHSGGPSSTAANFPSGVTTSTSLNPQIRPEGWWERNPSQLYGTTDQTVLPFYVRSQEGHFSAECSAVGTCDRSSGTCNCFAGYEGNACQRTTCPNECSGHGVCRSQSEYLALVDSEFEYGLWDADKYQRCICDAGYSGMDCSERLCPLGDDPLTTQGTDLELNYGLPETGEVQYLDVRCPYNGEMVDPYVAIVYTDANTGAQYQSSFFDPTVTTTAQGTVVLNALKDMPNDVLADFVVDGVTMRSKVQSVTITELETDTFYRLAITFDESMGDVPDLSGVSHPSMLCKGGAKVNTRAGDMQSVHENIAVIPIGEGPRETLKFRIQVIDDAAEINGVNNQSIFEYQVFDRYGNVFNDLDAQVHRPTDTSGSNLAVYDVLTNAAMFTREAAKVGFVWEFGEGQSGVADPSHTINDFLYRNNASRADNLIYEIDYLAEPVFEASNQLFTLTGEAVGNVTANNHVAHNLSFGAPVDTSPTYDLKVTIEILEDDYTPMALYINDEFVAYSNNSFSRGITPQNQNLFGGIPTGFDGVVPANGQDFVGPGNTSQLLSSQAGDVYEFFLPKRPVTIENTGPEDIYVAFFDNHAPVAESGTLIIKVVDTSTSIDRYTWKVAGDADFFGPVSGTGFPMTFNTSRLADAGRYSAMHPNDALRSSIENVFVGFNAGLDFSERVCGTSSTDPAAGLYYIQFGTGGINDQPVCSDRGMCDQSTGTCSCFSGYAGLDCSEQNALAGGGGGNFAL